MQSRGPIGLWLLKLLVATALWVKPTHIALVGPCWFRPWIGGPVKLAFCRCAGSLLYELGLLYLGKVIYLFLSKEGGRCNQQHGTSCERQGDGETFLTSSSAGVI